ncbi:MAG: NAD/NADP octopine/nopaline dehydrogenase family protein [Peptococcaceae bacterium]|nr:NAD/NADP octopine/nopaline dehydrogenase family protein [Peptococcaceae bacterium]
MKVTIIGAGNSGIAMAAHLSREGNEVTIWNGSRSTIEKLMKTKLIRCEGIIQGDIPVHDVTNDIGVALRDPDIVLITTPANSHKEFAELIAKNIKKSTVIVLNPGRTFGAFEFRHVYEKFNDVHRQIIAETQTIIYTCRKTAEDAVNVMAFKDSVWIAALDTGDTVDSEIGQGQEVIGRLPSCIRGYFTPAESVVQTSMGNMGMVLHCAPLLLNSGWTENTAYQYKYYHDGITPKISEFIEKIDEERMAAAKALGHPVESARDWMIRTYGVTGNTLYECIHNNRAYSPIEAPGSLNHRYIFEDIPYGLVPLEALGLKLGLDMSYTTLIIDLAEKLLHVDFRGVGRNLEYLLTSSDKKRLRQIFEGKSHHE